MFHPGDQLFLQKAKPAITPVSLEAVVAGGNRITSALFDALVYNIGADPAQLITILGQRPTMLLGPPITKNQWPNTDERSQIIVEEFLNHYTELPVTSGIPSDPTNPNNIGVVWRTPGVQSNITVLYVIVPSSTPAYESGGFLPSYNVSLMDTIPGANQATGALVRARMSREEEGFRTNIFFDRVALNPARQPSDIVQEVLRIPAAQVQGLSDEITERFSRPLNNAVDIDDPTLNFDETNPMPRPNGEGTQYPIPQEGGYGQQPRRFNPVHEPAPEVPGTNPRRFQFSHDPESYTKLGLPPPPRGPPPGYE